MKKTLILGIYLFLFCVGFDYELTNLIIEDYSLNHYLELFYSLGLLSIYIVPAVFLLHQLAKRVPGSQYLPGLAILTGLFLPGWIAGYGNDYLGSFLANSSWTDAVTAPIIEESVKLLCVYLLVYLLNSRGLGKIFIIGIGVGLGFQIMEDISYIIMGAADSTKEIIPQVVTRIVGSLSSHWAYTGIFSVGVSCLLMREHYNKKLGVLWTISPVVLHFLWNSPLNEGANNLLTPILSASTLLLIIQILRYLKEKDELLLG